MASAAEKPDPTTSSGTSVEDLVSNKERNTGSGSRTATGFYIRSHHLHCKRLVLASGIFSEILSPEPVLRSLFAAKLPHTETHRRYTQPSDKQQNNRRFRAAWALYMMVNPCPWSFCDGRQILEAWRPMDGRSVGCKLGYPDIELCGNAVLARIFLCRPSQKDHGQGFTKDFPKTRCETTFSGCERQSIFEMQPGSSTSTLGRISVSSNTYLRRQVESGARDFECRCECSYGAF
jgi:hypothetical protein